MFLTIFIILSLVFFVRGFQPFKEMMSFESDDPDSYYLDYMIHLYNKGSHFGHVSRIIQNGGADIHWSKFYPLCVDGFYWILHFFGLNSETALFVSAPLLGLVVWVLYLFLLPLILPSQDRKSKILVTAFAFFCVINPVVMTYATPLRGTHHVFMLFWAVLAALSFFRLKSSWLTGLFLILGVWTTPEFFPISLFFVAMGVFDPSFKTERLSAILFLLCSFVVILDPPPSRYGIWMPDHISYGYSVLYALIWVSVFSFDFLKNKFHQIKTFFYPVYSLIFLVIWVLVCPGYRYGVHSIIPNDIYNLWYVNVGEIRSVFSMDYSIWVVCGIFYILPCLICSFLLYKRSSSYEDYFVALVAFLTSASGFLHSRNLVVASFFVALLVLRTFSKPPLPQGTRWIVNIFKSRVTVYSCIVLLLFVVFYPLYHPTLAPSEANNCSIEEASPMIAHYAGTSGVFIEQSMAPALLWFTKDDQFKVTTGPYHRDHDSMRIYYSIKNDDSLSDDFKKSQMLMKNNNMSMIVFCPHSMIADMKNSHGSHIDKTLISHLITGYLPHWLEKVDVGGGLMAFRVKG